MQWLNYHHLLYFWVVAREGSISRATKELRLAQPTISGQLHRLEDALGEKLFERQGRALILTEIGRVVFRYADDIFNLGRELQDALKGKLGGRPLNLDVGIADVLPKLIALRLLEPALSVPEPVRIICRENRPERLIAELALHELDVVLTDAPAPPSLHVRTFSHLLGECGVAMFASPRLAATHRRGFPGSLEAAPLLLPTENTSLRRSLDQWFAARRIQPRVVGEFEDSALLEVFGQDGIGIFPAPTAITRDVLRKYQVRLVGHVDGVRERFYAISVERKLKHPAAIAILEAARHQLFSGS